MSKAVQSGSKYPDEIRINAAQLYAISGNYVKVAAQIGIPDRTVTDWSRLDIWQDTLAKAREQITDELLAQNLAIATAANEQIQDRIANGDTVITKDGTHTRLPMKGRDMAVVSGIMQDKGRVAMGLATSISGSTAGMADLADKFRQLSRDHAAIQDSVVSTQQSENQSLSESES